MPMGNDEAQEYVSKLQAGKTQLTTEASSLEREVLKTLGETSQKMRSLTMMQGDLATRATALKRQQEGVQAKLDSTGGEAQAYAKILVKAQDERADARAKAENAAKAEAAKSEIKQNEEAAKANDDDSTKPNGAGAPHTRPKPVKARSKPGDEVPSAAAVG